MTGAEGVRAELREAALAATPGPWVATANGRVFPPMPQLPQFSHPYEPLAEAGNPCDATFIAAASPDAILALLAERDALAEQVAQAKRERDETRLIANDMISERNVARAALARAEQREAEIDTLLHGAWNSGLHEQALLDIGNVLAAALNEGDTNDQQQ